MGLALIIWMISKALFLGGFESILDTAHLSGLMLSLAHHLWTTGSIIHDELLATSLALRRIATGIIVAHRRKTLVGDSAQIAAPLSVETYIVFLSWLH